jgi:hypothetical protein
MSANPSHGHTQQWFRFESPSSSRRKVFVLYTGVRETIDALRSATRFAAGLDLRVEVVVLRVVPYPLPIDKPPASPSIVISRFKELVESAGIDSTIRVYLCRNRREALTAVLPAGSTVVIGQRERWWPTSYGRLARWLRDSGQQVIFAEPLQMELQECSV